MKQPHRILIALLVLACLVFALGGCASTQNQERLMSTWEDVSEDGMLTPAEVQEVDGVLEAAVGEPLARRKAVEERLAEGDWKGAAVSAAFALLTTAGGMYQVNRSRNKREEKLWGTPSAPRDPTVPSTPVSFS